MKNQFSVNSTVFITEVSEYLRIWLIAFFTDHHNDLGNCHLKRYNLMSSKLYTSTLRLTSFNKFCRFFMELATPVFWLGFTYYI